MKSGIYELSLCSEEAKTVFFFPICLLPCNINGSIFCLILWINLIRVFVNGIVLFFFKKLWYKNKNKSMWIDKCVTCINICFLRILAIPSKTHNQQIHVSYVTTRSIKTIIYNASSSMLIIVIAECSWTNICWHIKFKVMFSFLINVVK